MSDDASPCPLAALCAEAERLLLARARAERVVEDARHEEERAHAARVVREADLSLDDIAARASALRGYLEPGPPALPGPVASRWMVVDGDPLGWLEG